MKKFILCVAAVSALTFGAFAQNNNSVQNKDSKPAIEKREMKQREIKPFADSKAFEGINLTADQKTKLNALAEENRKNMQKGGKEFPEGQQCPKGKDMKKGDSNKKQLTDAEKQQKKAEMQQKKQERMAQMKADRRKMLDGIKSILTPQQYNTFLENNWLAGKGQMKQKMHNGDRKMAQGDRNRGHKGGKQMGKGGKMAKGDQKMKGQDRGNRQAQGETKTSATV